MRAPATVPHERHGAAFLSRLKSATTGDSNTPLVLLGNFEVENAWARSEVGLPSVAGASASSALVNRMDEYALLLGAGGDIVVLKSAPDDGHLAHLSSLGFTLPEVVVVDEGHAENTVTEDALASPGTIRAITAVAPAGAHLLAHGCSAAEEQLGVACGLPLAHPSAATAKAVNGKVYSRLLCEELGIRQSPGWTMHTVHDFVDAVPAIEEMLLTGASVGVKDSYGVSGKGIVVISEPRRLYQLARMVERRATKSGEDRLNVVAEVWADKVLDLNYHVTIARDGDVVFDFVQEAITENGVHKGHRIPAGISEATREELRSIGELVGEKLASDGYFGPVGLDAITTADGSLLPVLDINARNNMSTYQTRIHERFLLDGSVAIARTYELSLDRRLSFEQVDHHLGDALLSPSRGAGAIVTNFATVNAAAPEADGAMFRGRFGCVLVAADAAELRQLDRRIAASLEAEGIARA
ncbi:hypothetical protein C5B85_16445 [Pseudoclavibacter sp. AY1F1]|uniref:preATP grasp domain-containing protein n=1 Tax=Pseudoclavibacter sp. AY1F1 TaxID=2080583 RepID=UPI000CE91B69|nr:ATP-grasp domain-containing protein [Pseudoclavibacter sp. AY1F1]PPF42354.1 hypothetical protein C5B85_16445 [Pseudoclavibacter sp. AY1F1]